MNVQKGHSVRGGGDDGGLDQSSSRGGGKKRPDSDWRQSQRGFADGLEVGYKRKKGSPLFVCHKCPINPNSQNGRIRLNEHRIINH